PLGEPVQKPERSGVAALGQGPDAPDERRKPFGHHHRVDQLVAEAPVLPGLADDLMDAPRRQPLPRRDLPDAGPQSQPPENPRPPRPLRPLAQPPRPQFRK